VCVCVRVHVYVCGITSVDTCHNIATCKVDFDYIYIYILIKIYTYTYLGAHV